MKMMEGAAWASQRVRAGVDTDDDHFTDAAGGRGASCARDAGTGVAAGKEGSGSCPGVAADLVPVDSAHALRRCLQRMIDVHTQACEAHGVPPNQKLLGDLAAAAKEGQAVPKILLSHSKLVERAAPCVAGMMAACADAGYPAEFVLSFNVMTTAGVRGLLRGAALAGVGVLELFACGITDAGCRVIASALAGNPPMQRLKLGDNSITHVGVRYLARALASNTALVQLHLGGNPLGDRAVPDLVAIKHDNWFLKSLGVRSCGITDAGFAALAPLFAQGARQGLTSLSLRGNAIAARGAKVLTQTLLRGAGGAGLLNGGRWGRYRLGAASLTPPPRACPLRALELQGCGLTAAVVATLCKGLRHTHIAELHISDNPLGDAGVEMFSAALSLDAGSDLALAQHLEILSLNDVHMTATGACAIAGLISRHTPSLTSLSLSSNDLGAAGGVAIAAALHQTPDMSTRLKCLCLNQCRIGVAGSIEMAKMLEHNTSLTALEYQGNYSSADGGAAWALALRQNATLVRLVLTDNEIPSTAMLQIQRALEAVNETLRVFNYGGQGAQGLRPTGNQITAELRQRIAKAVQRNRAAFQQRQADAVDAWGSLAVAAATPVERWSVVDHINAGLRHWLSEDVPPPLLELPDDGAPPDPVHDGASTASSLPTTPTTPPAKPLMRRALADITPRNVERKGAGGHGGVRRGSFVRVGGGGLNEWPF